MKSRRIDISDVVGQSVVQIQCHNCGHFVRAKVNLTLDKNVEIIEYHCPKCEAISVSMERVK